MPIPQGLEEVFLSQMGAVLVVVASKLVELPRGVPATWQDVKKIVAVLRGVRVHERLRPGRHGRKLVLKASDYDVAKVLSDASLELAVNMIDKPVDSLPVEVVESS